MITSALNREEIKKLINEAGLLENYIKLEIQLTPNGFDLTVARIFSFTGAGTLDFSNKERMLPEGEEIFPEKINSADNRGWWNLEKGTYKIITNESVNLPRDLIALAFSRTSLLRMGAFTQHGVWDAGFKGKGEFILTVGNNNGINIKQNSRIAQLVFLRINETSRGYNGIYQEK